MANCHVLEANQKPTDRPSKRIKRSGGHSLVRRGLAVWVRENVLLQMKVDSPVITSAQVYANSMTSPCRYMPNGPGSRSYIPEKLPANIDYQLGLIVKAPVLAGQVRFRAIADQRSNPAY